MFVRAEMLYTGAITASELMVNGDTVTGTTGDIEIFDSLDGVFGGNDSWEVTATLTSGTIAGVSPASIFVNPSYDFSAYTLSANDPVPAPLDSVQAVFPQFSLASVGGGTAYGMIDSYSVSGGAAPVPALGGWGVAVLMGCAILVARSGVRADLDAWGPR